MNPRIPQHYQYNVVFDLVRGGAALIVFMGHLIPYISRSFNLDTQAAVIGPFADFSVVIAVECFFVLSGILLGPILYKSCSAADWTNHLKIFLLRRWYRTLPVYYLGLLAFVFLYVVLGLQLPNDLGQHLIFLQSLWSGHENFYPVSWSLAVEEIFYVAFPALLFLGLYCSSRASIDNNFDMIFLGCAFTLILFSVLTRQMALSGIDNIEMELRRGTLYRLDAIAIGVVIAVYKGRLLKIFGCYIAGLILLQAIFISLVYGQNITLISAALSIHVLMSVTPWLLGLCIFQLSSNWTLKPRRLITFWADISYPLHILHLPIMLGVMYWVGTPGVFTYIGLICGIPLCAYCVFKYIETPILKRRPPYPE